MLLLSTLNLIFAMTAANFVCPNDWKVFKLSNGVTKCIKPFYEMVSRDEAQRRCRSLGNNSTLVEVHSQMENDKVVDSFIETNVLFHLSIDKNHDMFNYYKPQIWIGPKRIPSGGLYEFEYNSGCGIKSYSNWHKGQPNDYDNSQNCVFIYIDDYKLWGQWVDYPCYTKMYYVCQRVSDPKPPCNTTNYNLYNYTESDEDQVNVTTYPSIVNNNNYQIEVIKLPEPTNSHQNDYSTPPPNKTANAVTPTKAGTASNGNNSIVGHQQNTGTTPMKGGNSASQIGKRPVRGQSNSVNSYLSFPYQLLINIINRIEFMFG